MEQEVINFIFKVLKTEYQATVAQLTERNDDYYRAKVQEINQLFGPSLDSGIFRPAAPGITWFNRRESSLNRKAQRKLFMIKEYEHPTYGRLYRSYVSTDRVKGQAYFYNYYVAKTDEGFKVIARYLIDRESNKWEWNGGIRIKEHGKLVETHKFQAPADPVHLADYEVS